MFNGVFSDSAEYIPKQSENVPGRNKLKNYLSHIGMLQHQVNDRQDMLIKRDAKIQELETKLAAADQKLIESGAREAKLQQELAERDTKIQKLETKLAAVDRTDELSHDFFKQDEEEIIALNQHIKKISDERDKLNKKYADVEAANENLLDTIRTQESRIARFQAALRESVNESEEMTKQIAEVQLNCEKQMEQIQKLESTLKLSDRNHKERVKDLKKIAEPTHIYIELGKLYVELQEAKKPQEAVGAQLAAKEKEIEYLTKQHEAKLAAKDSEIQNLKETVKEEEEKKKRLMVTITNLQMKIKVYDSEEAEKNAAAAFSIRPGMNFGYGDPDEEW
ncbi:hypothetical protein GCK72_026097 [Caenorhabditis remanei]|uniref:Uncharacterized protein n=1 Tax=Caenorhabditis remanei TaxID=31234 RepID=A0A6A5G556_CAERE|nr:hypothetical protein GCK72_026097 [Caenorhabditis remanei]KAF1749629.1 hypothetical protein GCK72_026097 [Caenorhabditis remanei]